VDLKEINRLARIGCTVSNHTAALRTSLKVLGAALEYADFIQARIDEGSWCETMQRSPEDKFLRAVKALRCVPPAKPST
jgi:hypothetical protein